MVKVKKFKNGLPKIRTISGHTTNAAANTPRVTFADTMRTYETAAANGTDAEKAAAVYRFGKAVAYSVLRKLEAASANNEIFDLRRAARMDAANMEKISFNAAVSDQKGKDNEKAAIDTAANYAYTDAMDIIQAAIVTALSETAKGHTNFEATYTKRTLDKRVIIRDESAKWKDIETCGVRETFRAARDVISNNRSVTIEPTCKYMYLSYLEKTTDDNGADVWETIYRRLPKWSQITTHCNIHGGALSTLTVSSDGYIFGNIDAAIASMNLSDKETKVLQYRLRGYGTRAIASALGVKPQSVADTFGRIQDKFAAAFPDIANKYIPETKRILDATEKAYRAAAQAERRAKAAALKHKNDKDADKYSEAAIFAAARAKNAKYDLDAARDNARRAAAANNERYAIGTTRRAANDTEMDTYAAARELNANAEKAAAAERAAIDEKYRAAEKAAAARRAMHAAAAKTDRAAVTIEYGRRAIIEPTDARHAELLAAAAARDAERERERAERRAEMCRADKEKRAAERAERAAANAAHRAARRAYYENIVAAAAIERRELETMAAFAADIADAAQDRKATPLNIARARAAEKAAERAAAAVVAAIRKEHAAAAIAAAADYIYNR